MSNDLCPQCGSPIRKDLPGGMCPVCLMAMAKPAEEDVDATAAMSSKIEPPELERLANAFPELEILQLIGRGGMGAVYLAKQKSLDRLVALKIFLLRNGDSHFEERFSREAKALARLNHPNIVTVFDFGQRDPYHFLLMEYIDGLNLRQVSEGTRLSAEHALQLVPQLCDALQYAHDNGVVHRDIKPENVLMDQSGNIRIADFGLAKITGGTSDTTLTQTKQVMGTVNYMAPEQRERPTEVDHRADIYSLGVVIYELLTGELPLGRFQPPSKKVHVDVRLDEVVLRALEKEPELRYQQASEFKTGIQNATNASSPQFASTPPSQFANAAIAPVKPVKVPVDAQAASNPIPYAKPHDDHQAQMIMRFYSMFATLVCVSCAFVFVLGTEEANLISEKWSRVVGTMIAMSGGFLFAISGFIRRIIGARPEEPDDQKDYDKSTWQGACVRIVAMAMCFGCGAIFVIRNMLDVHQQTFFVAGISSAITGAMLFVLSGFVDEIARTKR